MNRIPVRGLGLSLGTSDTGKSERHGEAGRVHEGGEEERDADHLRVRGEELFDVCPERVGFCVTHSPAFAALTDEFFEDYLLLNILVLSRDYTIVPSIGVLAKRRLTLAVRF